MGVAKILAERSLGVPWLLHAETLRQEGSLELQAGSTSRADLVGQDVKKNWHVVEAKGRSRKPGRSVLDKAKKQAERILFVNGNEPDTRCACVCHIKDGPWEVIFEDPPNVDGVESAIFHVDVKSFFELYYEPFLTLRESGLGYREITIEPLKFESLKFQVVDFLGSHLQIGLRSDVLDVVYHMKDSESTMDSLYTLFADAPVVHEGNRYVSIGRDGYMVSVSKDLFHRLSGE